MKKSLLDFFTRNAKKESQKNYTSDEDVIPFSLENVMAGCFSIFLILVVFVLLALLYFFKKETLFILLVVALAHIVGKIVEKKSFDTDNRVSKK